MNVACVLSSVHMHWAFLFDIIVSDEMESSSKLLVGAFSQGAMA